MTDQEIAKHLIHHHPHKGVVNRCLFIELRLACGKEVDETVLQEMRDIHAGGDVPE